MLPGQASPVRHLVQPEPQHLHQWLQPPRHRFLPLLLLLPLLRQLPLYLLHLLHLLHVLYPRLLLPRLHQPKGQALAASLPHRPPKGPTRVMNRLQATNQKTDHRASHRASRPEV